MGQKALALALLSPLLLLISLIFFYPIVYSVYLSFFKVGLGTQQQMSMEFVGLDNYISIFRDPQMRGIVPTTLYFVVADIILSFTIGLALSLLLNQQFRGNRICRALIIIPWAIPVVVSGQIWKWIFSSPSGIINTVLLKLGVTQTYIPWLVDSRYALNSLIFAQVWAHVPIAAIILLAALQTVPTDLYEAAEIDGASAFQRFRHVTLPTIRDIIIITLVLLVIFSSKTFDMVFVITAGSFKTMVYYFYVYVQGFVDTNIGYSVALGYLLFGIIVVLSVFYVRAVFPGRKQ